MAKKKDLAKAAQDATRMMFGTPAEVLEIVEGMGKRTFDASKIDKEKAVSAFDRLTEGLPIKSEDELKDIFQASLNRSSYNELSDRLLRGISTGHNTVEQLANITHVKPEEVISDVFLTRLFKMFPPDAPEAPEKRRRGRPKKNTEPSGIKPDTALTEMLQERRKEAEATKQGDAKEKKTVTRKVVFTEKTPTTPISKTIEVTKATKNPAKKNRTKNSGDYLRLDMVSEGTDLKKYVSKMARIKGVSMTAYIQDLILKDMKKNEGKSFTITV